MTAQVDFSALLQSANPGMYNPGFPQHQQPQPAQNQMMQAPPAAVVKRKSPTAQERRIKSAHKILTGEDRFGLEYIKLIIAFSADESELNKLMDYVLKLYRQQ
jgi:hypothetical protein